MSVIFLNIGKCIECGTKTKNKMTFIEYDEQDNEIEILDFFCEECVDREAKENTKNILQEYYVDYFEEYWC